MLLSRSSVVVSPTSIYRGVFFCFSCLSSSDTLFLATHHISATAAPQVFPYCPLMPPPCSHLQSTRRHNNLNSSPLCGRWQRHPPTLVQKGITATLFTVGLAHPYTHSSKLLTCPSSHTQRSFLCSSYPSLVGPVEGVKRNKQLINPQLAQSCIFKSSKQGPVYQNRTPALCLRRNKYQKVHYCSFISSCSEEGIAVGELMFI